MSCEWGFCSPESTIRYGEGKVVATNPLIDGFFFLCQVNPLTIYLTIDTV